MEGIFAAFNFKGIDKNFSDKDYFYSPHSKIVKKEKFIFVIGKNKGLTINDYHFDERYELLSVSRIDNKNSLLKEYNLSKDTTNSELILFLFKKFKTHAFNKIFGGFSVIIIDKKNNKIKAFTDHLNQKPLFYSKNQTDFFFSSSIESLFQSGIERNQICDETLLDYLICGAPRFNKTIYKNINILPNNCFLKLNKKKKVKIKSFYAFKTHVKKNFKNSNYYVLTVKEIFFKTIEEQLMQTDTNVSFALSGGLDSSSVVCVANKINIEKKLNKNLSTNSAIFPSLKGEEKRKADETNFIKLVLDKKNLDHNYHYFSEKGSLSILDKLTDFNEPIMGPNAYINDEILEKVKLEKQNVFFDGNGGDNTISHGYSRLFQMGRNFDFYNLFLEYRAFCKKKQINFYFFSVLKRFVLFQLLPDFLHRYIYSRKKNRLDFFNLNLILKKDKKINILKRIEKVYGHHPRALYSRKYPISFFEEKSVADIYNTYEARLTYELCEKNKIEILSPFLDKRLIEFCLKVPLSEKFKNGEDRFYFRKAMKGIIPKEIEYRTSKGDISPLFIDEIIKFPLKLILEIVFKRNSPLADILEKKLVISLHQDFIEKEDVTLASFFYKLIYLGSWLNKRLT